MTKKKKIAKWFDRFNNVYCVFAYMNTLVLMCIMSGINLPFLF